MNLRDFKIKFGELIEGIRAPLRQERVASILVALFFITPLIFSAFGVENYTTIKYTTVLILSAWSFFEILRSPKISLVNKKTLYIPLLIFFVGICISTVSAYDPILALTGQYRRFTNSFLFLTAWVGLITVIASTRIGSNGIKMLIRASLVAVFLNSFYGLFQSFGLSYYKPPTFLGYARVPGFIGNANFVAMYVSVMLPFWLIAILEAKTKFTRYVLIFASLVCAVSLMVFSSRGAALGALVGLVFTLGLGLFKLRKSKLFLGLFSVLALLVVFISYLNFSGVRYGSLASTDINISSRLFVWQSTTEIFERYPLTGVGLGNFEIEFLKERPNFMGSADYYYDDPHNVFLYLAAEGGILTILGFLLLIVFALRETILGFLRTGDNYLLAISAGIIIWCVTGSFTPVEITNWIILALLLSAAFAYLPFIKIEFSLSRILKMLVRSLALVSILVGLSFAISEPFMEFAAGYYGGGNYSLGYKVGRISMVLNPLREQAYLPVLGSSFAMGVDNEQIITWVKRYARLHPYSYRVVANSGVMYYELYRDTGNEEYLEESISYLNRAQELNPRDRGPSQVLANIYFQRDQVAKARILTFENLVISQTPSQLFDDLALLSRMYHDEGKYKEMLFILEKIYKLQPVNPKFKNFLQLVKKENEVSKIDIPVRFQPSFFY